MVITYYLKRIIKLGLKRKGVLLVCSYFTLLVISSLTITWVEPSDSALTDFGQAFWWSIVTSTTVGYGDLFPASNAGKIVAVILPMFMGIGLGAAFITHVASWFIERRDKKMHGEKPYPGEEHILLVGFTEETEQLINEIQNDEGYVDQEIVLVANIDRHPFSDKENLFFVKGRPDTIDTLNKAATANAQQIVIHTGSDEESLFALINVIKLKSDNCDVTVRCLSSQSMDTFSSVHGDFQIILQMTAEMMVQAMSDRVHLPLQVLLRNNEDDEIYYVTVPESVEGLNWWDVHTYLKENFDYLTFALQGGNKKVAVNPSKELKLSRGDGIWLIANTRPENIRWPG